MSAADRIEEVVAVLVARHDTETELGADTDYAKFWHGQIESLRAIAAELRGAPALTEAERAFFEAAAAYCETQVDFPGEYLFGAMLDAYRAYRAYRALRTERTPS